MALIFIDGFDHYVSADISKKWSEKGTIGNDMLPTSGRRGGGCMSARASYPCKKNLNAGYQRLILGAAVNARGFSFALATMLGFYDALGSTMLSIAVSPSGTILAYRGNFDTLLGSSAPNTFTSAGYNYLEAKVFIHDTLGSIEIRYNNVTVLSLSNIDTKVGTSTQITTFGIASSASDPWFWDDLYVADDSGTVNNDFLGDIRIDTLRPNGPGTYQAFTPSSGVDHAALVDEAFLDTADFLTGVVTGDKESFTFGDLPAVGPVKGIQLTNAVAKADAGASQVRNFIRLGGNDYPGVNYAPGVSYQFVTTPFGLNPDGSVAWTSAAVNALESGVEVTT